MLQNENKPARFWFLFAMLSFLVGIVLGCSKQSGVAPGPSAPAILSFSASPGAVMPGGTSVLSWTVSGATKIEIDQGIGVVTGTTQSVSPTATTTYVLTASNDLGSSQATATVTVGGGTTGSTSGSTGAGGGSGSTTTSSSGPTGSGSGGSSGTGAGGAGTGGSGVGGGGGGIPSSPVAFPLKASANGHYLVDQKGAPFRVQGDAAWSLISNLTASEIDMYLADRKARGFNVLMVSLIEHSFAVKAPQNRAGDFPFTAHTSGSYDFTTPNEPYFAFADAAIDKAAASGMAVLLAVMYAGSNGGNEGWWNELNNSANTRAKCYQYGQFLGNRYKNKGNIIWVISGDYTPPAGSEGEARLIQIYQGIRAAGATQLATSHLRVGTQSTDWAAFAQYVQVQGVYETDAKILQNVTRGGYSRKPALPAFEIEDIYEGEWPPAGDPAPTRGQLWWSQLGAIGGVFYGHRDIWEFSTDTFNSGYPFPHTRWQLALDTPGSNAVRAMASLYATLPWYDLVPSGIAPMKNIVTAGGSSVGNDDYVAAAATADGKAIVAYLPAAGAANRAITVDMSVMSGPSKARWMDPTNGMFTDAGSGIANSGTHVFTVPRANASGANDWVLVVTL
jgi:hypothetical protein